MIRRHDRGAASERFERGWYVVLAMRELFLPGTTSGGDQQCLPPSPLIE